jgi:hypothetical protein
VSPGAHARRVPAGVPPGEAVGPSVGATDPARPLA